MLIYQIILEYSLPLNIQAYRSASSIKLPEAVWIFESFPFEEPSYFELFPEEGPPPQILFANFRSKNYLLINYVGDTEYQVFLGKSLGAIQSLGAFQSGDVKKIIEAFGAEDLPYRKLHKKIYKLVVRPRANGFLSW